MQNYKELADIYEPLKQSVGLEVRPPAASLLWVTPSTVHSLRVV